jgi:hypothetical protein
VHGPLLGSVTVSSRAIREPLHTLSSGESKEGYLYDITWHVESWVWSGLVWSGQKNERDRKIPRVTLVSEQPISDTVR